MWQILFAKVATNTSLVPHAVLEPLLSHEEVESVFPPLETGWHFVTAWINRVWWWKWPYVTSYSLGTLTPGIQPPLYEKVQAAQGEARSTCWTSSQHSAPTYQPRMRIISRVSSSWSSCSGRCNMERQWTTCAEPCPNYRFESNEMFWGGLLHNNR